jgi:cytochrome b involved in lipid metabolism
VSGAAWLACERRQARRGHAIKTSELALSGDCHSPCTNTSCSLISTSLKMAQRFSKDDVAKHKTADDLYIVVDEDVYDLTKFADEHPGGKKSKPSEKHMTLLVY